MTAVFDVDADRIEPICRRLVEADRMCFVDESNEFPNPYHLIITPAGSHATVMLPDPYGDGHRWSETLSRELGAKTMWLQIYDGDLWMYVLFDRGEEIGWFNPVPDYFEGEISEAERKKWSGDIEALTRALPHVDRDLVAPYHVTWDIDEESPGKAHPDDEFEFGCDWQICDFMRRLGLTYPVTDSGERLGRSLKVVRNEDLKAKAAGETPSNRSDSKKKPWWRFW